MPDTKYTYNAKNIAKFLDARVEKITEAGSCDREIIYELRCASLMLNCLSDVISALAGKLDEQPCVSEFAVTIPVYLGESGLGELVEAAYEIEPP